MKRRTFSTMLGVMLVFIITMTLVLVPGVARAAGKPIFLYMSYTGVGTADSNFIAAAHQLGRMLEEKVGSRIVVIVPPGDMKSSNDFVIRALQKGKADFALQNIFSYLITHQSPGAESILISAAGGRMVYYSQFVVHNQSGLDELSDLDGINLCWVDQLSTSGYIIPTLMLKAAGIVAGPDPQYTGSHQNVIRQIYDGQCAAGAVYEDVRTLMVEEFPDVFDVIRVIELSPVIPNPFGFTVSDNVPADVTVNITNALVDISQEEEGLAVLQKLGLTTLIPVDHSLYIGIENLITEAGMTPQEVWDSYIH